MLISVEPGVPKGVLDEVADGVGRAGGEDVVVGLVGLEYAPHPLDVLGGVAPVASGVEVAEVELGLEACSDAGGSHGDLAGHERLATAG